MEYNQKEVKEVDEWVVKNKSYETTAREVEKRYFEVLKGRSDEIQSKRH